VAATSELDEDIRLTQKEALTRIKEGVSKLQKAMYVDPGDAFGHYAVKLLFDLDDDDTYEALSAVSDADRGVDACWLDQSDRVVMVQAKYSASGRRAYDQKLVRQLESAYTRLTRLAAKPSRDSAGMSEVARSLEQRRTMDEDYPVDLYCVVVGSFSAEAKSRAKAFNTRHAAAGVSMKLVGLAEIAQAESERISREADLLDERILLPLASWFKFRPVEGAPDTVVGSVNGIDLARIERKHQYRIFQRNVRYYLKKTQRVNKGMAKTLEQDDRRHNFWYYNNGIAIVCSKLEVEEQPNGTAKAFLTNLQIVNGCQTTTTLGEKIGELDDPDHPAFVLVRIIESGSEELQRDITLYNNRQTAVRDRDLMSNNEVQDDLQDAFAALDPPWFYERKRGEWKALCAADNKLDRKFDGKIIDNEAAAQAAFAFWHDPAEARARKRLLFVPGHESGYYDRIFNKDTTPERLLVPYLLNEYIVTRKQKYQQRVKAIPDPRNPSVAEKQLLSRAWVNFGDQFLLGAMRYYMGERVSLDDAGLRKLLDDDFDAITVALYRTAVQDLHLFFRDQKGQADKAERPYTFANAVKGNWAEALDRVAAQDQWRNEEEEDPFEGVPLLSRG
jgi:hypothetical protein